MTLGTRKNDQGKKELLLVLSDKEIPDFEDGKPVVKRSGDKFGEFDVTVVVSRTIPIHKDAKDGFWHMEADGQYIYRGFTVVNNGGIGYKTEECDYAADTLNELLHKLDNHPEHNGIWAAMQSAHGTATYKGHKLETVGNSYIVDDKDSRFFDTVLDAIHAIDRGECDW